MKEVLLICDKTTFDTEPLQRALADSYSLLIEQTPKEALITLQAQPDVAAVLVDIPSQRAGMQELISIVSEENSSILTIPILILTDRETMEADLAYLGGAVVDCVEKPIHPRLLRNRLERAMELINSMTFTEFAQVLKLLPANIYLKDSAARYVFSSQTWHHLETDHTSVWSIRGKTDPEIRKDKKNAELALASDLEIIRTGKGTSYIIEENDDGQQEFLQVIKEPIKYSDGRVRGIIALINNVTEQERLKRELRKQSVTDALTGLYNRSYLNEYYHTLSADAYPLTILSADCDGLKRINDSYGHLVGDEYIRMTVTLFRTNLPEESMMFRTGGDEFLIFLPHTTAQQAHEYIKTLDEAAGTYFIRGNQLSVSVGASTMEHQSCPLQDSFKLSDEAMYREKQRKKEERI